MPKAKFATPYSRAREAFKEFDEFAGLLQSSMRHGNDERYARNRLHRSFAAGWNAKTSMILDVLNEMTAKKESKDNGND